MAVLECPLCCEAIEIKPPDRLHIAFSLEKPIPKSYYGDIVKKRIQCQNPNCKKLMIVFWYSPLEYFSRI